MPDKDKPYKRGKGEKVYRELSCKSPGSCGSRKDPKIKLPSTTTHPGKTDKTRTRPDIHTGYKYTRYPTKPDKVDSKAEERQTIKGELHGVYGADSGNEAQNKINQELARREQEKQNKKTDPQAPDKVTTEKVEPKEAKEGSSKKNPTVAKKRSTVNKPEAKPRREYHEVEREKIDHKTGDVKDKYRYEYQKGSANEPSTRSYTFGKYKNNEKKWATIDMDKEAEFRKENPKTYKRVQAKKARKDERGDAYQNKGGRYYARYARRKGFGKITKYGFDDESKSKS